MKTSIFKTTRSLHHDLKKYIQCSFHEELNPYFYFFCSKKNKNYIIQWRIIWWTIISCQIMNKQPKMKKRILEQNGAIWFWNWNIFKYFHETKQHVFTSNYISTLIIMNNKIYYHQIRLGDDENNNQKHEFEFIWCKMFYYHLNNHIVQGLVQKTMMKWWKIFFNIFII